MMKIQQSTLDDTIESCNAGCDLLDSIFEAAMKLAQDKCASEAINHEDSQVSSPGPGNSLFHENLDKALESLKNTFEEIGLEYLGNCLKEEHKYPMGANSATDTQANKNPTDKTGNNLSKYQRGSLYCSAFKPQHFHGVEANPGSPASKTQSFQLSEETLSLICYGESPEERYLISKGLDVAYKVIDWVGIQKNSNSIPDYKKRSISSDKDENFIAYLKGDISPNLLVNTEVNPGAPPGFYGPPQGDLHLFENLGIGTGPPPGYFSTTEGSWGCIGRTLFSTSREYEVSEFGRGEGVGMVRIFEEEMNTQLEILREQENGEWIMVHVGRIIESQVKQEISTLSNYVLFNMKLVETLNHNMTMKNFNVAPRRPARAKYVLPSQKLVEILNFIKEDIKAKVELDEIISIDALAYFKSYQNAIFALRRLKL